MKVVMDTWQYLSGLAELCTRRGFTTQACQDQAWWLIGVPVLILLIIAWMIFRRIRLHYRLQRARVRAEILRWEREQIHAEPEVMRAAQWNGEMTATDDETARMAEQIKEGLKLRKINGQQP